MWHKGELASRMTKLALWTSRGFWQVVMTVGPLAAGAVGASIIRRHPRRFGWVLVSYVILVGVIALAPFVLAGASDSPDVLRRPLLVESKVSIAIGALLLLSAAGLSSRRSRPGAL